MHQHLHNLTQQRISGKFGRSWRGDVYINIGVYFHESFAECGVKSKKLVNMIWTVFVLGISAGSTLHR